MVEVLSYKHDGSFHRGYRNLLLLEENDDEYILGTHSLTVMENDGRVWGNRLPVIFVLSKKDFYNILFTFNSTGPHIYCNIASPSILDNGYLKYIDYDYDVKIVEENITGLDRRDFIVNKKKYEYDDGLCEVIESTYKNMLYRAEKLLSPFSRVDIKGYFIKLMDR